MIQFQLTLIVIYFTIFLDHPMWKDFKLKIVNYNKNLVYLICPHCVTFWTIIFYHLISYYKVRNTEYFYIIGGTYSLIYIFGNAVFWSLIAEIISFSIVKMRK